MSAPTLTAPEGGPPADDGAATAEKSLDELIAEERAAHARKIARLRRDARSVWSAMEGWGGIQSPDDWERVCLEADDRYASGRWLIDRLGAEHVMDPLTTATIWALRQKLIEDHRVETAAETMLVDCAVISYFTALKIQGLIGNSVITTEHEFFRDDGPSVHFRERYGRQVASELSVECAVERLVLVL